MSQSDAGKTDKVANNFRTPQWEESKLWKTKAKNQRIFEENKDLIEGSNVDIVEYKTSFDFRVRQWDVISNKGGDWHRIDSFDKEAKAKDYIKTKTVEVKGE
jgi:hypothetical protein